MRTHYIGRIERKAATRVAPAPRISFRWLTNVGKRLDRWFLGGSTPRGSVREFPEVEFHQMLAGKKDYLDPPR